MQAQERKEILMIMKADTLVDPDAMMVEFLNAVATHTTVFGACWFIYEAGSAFLPRFKHDLVIFEAFDSMIQF